MRRGTSSSKPRVRNIKINESNVFYYQLFQIPTSPQVGIITELPTRTSLASAVLVSPTRVLTAAHNLQDASVHVSRVNVVLGSIYLFSGGIRLVSTDYILHENWNPSTIRNDIAMINLPMAVATSSKYSFIILFY